MKRQYGLLQMAQLHPALFQRLARAYAPIRAEMLARLRRSAS